MRRDQLVSLLDARYPPYASLQCQPIHVVECRFELPDLSVAPCAGDYYDPASNTIDQAAFDRAVRDYDQLRKEKDLRAVAESQRNQAFKEARDQIVERIKTSNVADAQHLIAGLLAAPLPGLPQAVPQGRATAPGPDALVDPDL